MGELFVIYFLEQLISDLSVETLDCLQFMIDCSLLVECLGGVIATQDGSSC